MYKAQRFDSIYDLKNFLNENEIKLTEIIGIYRTPTSPYNGVYDLLYYVENAGRGNKNASSTDNRIK